LSNPAVPRFVFYCGSAVDDIDIVPIPTTHGEEAVVAVEVVPEDFKIVFGVVGFRFAEDQGLAGGKEESDKGEKE